jgi:hypothetical protein
MNYNPFSNNPLLGQLPTSYMSGPSGTRYGFGTTGFRQNYGVGQSRVSPLSIQDLSASQKSEFERLGGVQKLESEKIQQQIAANQLRESQMNIADIEEQRRIRDIIGRGPQKYSFGDGAPQMGYIPDRKYLEASSTPLGIKYQLEIEKNKYELDTLRNMRGGSGGGFGGFGSWSTPSFPSQGGMG